MGRATMIAGRIRPRQVGRLVDDLAARWEVSERREGLALRRREGPLLRIERPLSLQREVERRADASVLR